MGNVRRATDHRVTVWSGYRPIGLLSCRVAVSQATISNTLIIILWYLLMRCSSVERRANVLLGCHLPGLCPPVTILRANILSGYWPGSILSKFKYIKLKRILTLQIDIYVQKTNDFVLSKLINFRQWWAPVPNWAYFLDLVMGFEEIEQISNV